MSDDASFYRLITICNLIVFAVLVIYHSIVKAESHYARAPVEQKEQNIKYEQIYRDILFNSQLKVLLADCLPTECKIVDVSPGMMKFLNVDRIDIISTGLEKWLDTQTILTIKRLCETNHYPFRIVMQGYWKINNRDMPVAKNFTLYRASENQTVAIILNIEE